MRSLKGGLEIMGLLAHPFEERCANGRPAPCDTREADTLRREFALLVACGVNGLVGRGGALR